MVRWGGLRLEPYKPNAVDADNDGIVQEGTAFERPLGTRLLNRLGKEIAAGFQSADPIDGIRIVDGNGKNVSYSPTWSGKIRGERRGADSTGLRSLKDRGILTVGDMSPSLKDRGLSIGDRQDMAKESVLRSDRPTGDFGKPFMADNIDHALEMIEDGHFVELQDPEQVNTLLDRLAEIVADAKEKGVDAPNYNLCTVSVAGTNIFCAEQFENTRLDNLRSEMPQLGGNVVPGSPADKKLRAMVEEAKQKGEKIPTEVDAADEWIADLRKRGITVTPKEVKASELHASQKELVGEKVAGMVLSGENPDIDWSPDQGSIFISRDGYVIDGHHRWAAVVGMDAADGVLGDEMMKVIEVDLSIHEVLADALEFTKEFGIAPKAAKAKDVG